MYEVIKTIYKNGKEKESIHICFTDNIWEALEAENREIDRIGREDYLNSMEIWIHSEELF